MADPDVVEVQGGAAQGDAVPVPGPLGVGQHQVRARVGLDVLVRPDVADNLGALVFEHLAALGVVVMVVGVEQVLDRRLGHLSDLDQHIFCVSLVHRVNYHDALKSLSRSYVAKGKKECSEVPDLVLHNKHGDVGAPGGVGVDARGDLPGLWLLTIALLLPLGEAVTMEAGHQDRCQGGQEDPGAVHDSSAGCQV